MKFSLKEKTRTLPKYMWILLAIMLVGIFFRTYNFHDWLLFESDQVRDATLVGQVLANEKPWPLLGPTMRASSDTKETLFRIGPMYYYFQIFSGMVFGMKASVMAYPDVFFNILSIPLLFYFFKRYFGNGISLLLLSFYSVSFFAIKYSRFAWNPNLIPFFVILFLLSTHEFLVKKEKVSWLWVGVYGVTIGVGVQLHATTLILFPLIFGVSMAYLLMKRVDILKKLLVVLFLIFLINTPQIISELQTTFANSRILFQFSTREDSVSKKSFPLTVADTLGCFVEGNAYILSPSEDDNCTYSYVRIWEDGRSGDRFRSGISGSWLFISLIFSILGYFLLGYRFHKEQDESKKYFLGLIIILSAFFFLLMLPIIRSGFKEFRYFGPVFFVPYIFFGMIVEILIRKRKEIQLSVVILMSIFIIATNLEPLFAMATRLSDQKGNNGHVVFFGEIENIVVYMKDNSKFSKKMYVMSDRMYTGNIFRPGMYMAKQYGYELIQVIDLENVPKGANVFYLGENDEKSPVVISDARVKSMKNFGGMRVYQLEY